MAPQKMIQIEDEILTRCQGGDKAAFRWVVQTYQRMLFSLALKMLADEEEAIPSSLLPRGSTQ